MDKMIRKFRVEFINNWFDRTFLLGANINSNESFGDREYYLCLYLGFWAINIGFWSGVD